MDLIIFDNDGSIINKIELSTYETGKPFYYRISETCFHTLCVKTEFVLFKESISGPFFTNDTIYAPWSPVEENQEEISKFMAETVSSKYGTANELPIEETLEILNNYNTLNWNKKLYPWKK